MAYNTSKGPRDLGDLKNESDTDTQIDWDDDKISFKTDSTVRLVIDNNRVSGSGTLHTVGAATFGSTLATTGSITSTSTISGTVFQGDGSSLTGIDVLSYTNPTNNRIITSVDSSTINGETNLTFNGSLLQVGGVISASSDLHAVGDVTCGATLATTGSFTCSGSIRGKQAHITEHAYNVGGTAERLIPFYNLTDNSPGATDYLQQMIAPFAGRLLRVVFRPENGQSAGTNTYIRLYKNTDTNQTLNGATLVTHEEVECNSNASTSNIFTFSGSSHFSQGEIVGISITPQTGPNDVNVTCVWEFDIFI